MATNVKALAKQLRQNDRSLDEIESCFDGDAHRRLGGFNGTFGFVSAAVWLDFGKSVPRCKHLKILKCDSMHYDRGVFTVCACASCLPCPRLADVRLLLQDWTIMASTMI
jgi:hypothetical protein